MKITELENELSERLSQLSELRELLAKHEAKRPPLAQLSLSWDSWLELKEKLNQAISNLASETERLQAVSDRTKQAQEIAGKMGVSITEALTDEEPGEQERRALAAHMAERLGWNLSPEQRAGIKAEYEKGGLL